MFMSQFCVISCVFATDQKTTFECFNFDHYYGYGQEQAYPIYNIHVEVTILAQWIINILFVII